MSSDSAAAQDVSQKRDATSVEPLSRRTTSSTLSNPGNAFSTGSSDTAESSRAASLRKRVSKDSPEHHAPGTAGTKDGQPSTDGRRSHRTIKSRNSGGGFLLGSTFVRPAEGPTASAPVDRSSRSYSQNTSSKRASRPVEKRLEKRLSRNIGNSPLAANVTNATPEQAAESKGEGRDASETLEMLRASPSPARLDVDSAQIVNLALNLSESRKIAARRNISTTIPPGTPGHGDEFAGGSLRHHLQQQRKVSRNLSPKAERAATASPRVSSGQRLTPLQGSFDSPPDAPYQYIFSASTLVRAEKAKNALELMTQYRRLLQYVPPLKPPPAEKSKPGSAAGTVPGSPEMAPFDSSKSAGSSVAPLLAERQYNPLQYIRNRKVRARERKAIDGEAQGFGDAQKVSRWIDEIARGAQDTYSEDYFKMPKISEGADAPVSPRTSPRAGPGKVQVSTQKMKRPRVDWSVNTADMIADVFWMEQDDNRYSIEDRHGRHIFSRGAERTTPNLRGKSPESERAKILDESPNSKRASGFDLKIETRLPPFKSSKVESESYFDSTASKLKGKLRDVKHNPHMMHGHNGSVQHSHNLHSRSRSRSDSSESDNDKHYSRRRRSGTDGSHDPERDIFEKQMAEMLAKEAAENGWPTSPPAHRISLEKRSLSKMDHLFRSHSRSNSKQLKDNIGKPKEITKSEPRGRSSLDVPGASPRDSWDDLDITAPNSPMGRIHKITSAIISPRSRPTSPTRRGLSRVRSVINPIHEDSQERDYREIFEESHGPDEMMLAKEQTPEMPEVAPPDGRPRSISPEKRMIKRGTDKSSKSGSLRRAKEESGIRGLFKGTRGPVARVSDFLWKKESPAGSASGFLTDDSDGDEFKTPIEPRPGRTRSDTLDEVAKKDAPTYMYDLPSFQASRGRERGRNDGDESPRNEFDRRDTQDPEKKLGPPRIDVQNASPEGSPRPDGIAFDRKNSDGSELTRRGSSPRGSQTAGDRLNDAILGLPGKHRRGHVTVNGLSLIDPSTPDSSNARQRQWSISDRGVSMHRGPTTKREIARVRALLLSSGVKAAEITQRANKVNNLGDYTTGCYKDIASFTSEPLPLVPRSKEHLLAAALLSSNITHSTKLWQASADAFSQTAISALLGQIDTLQLKLTNELTPSVRQAADDADEVSKDLVMGQTLRVKRLGDGVDKMMRRRRRRLRWVRRGGWVCVEWALVGVMWLVWLVVTLVRCVLGLGKGVWGLLKWLLWL